jgi:murein tripeptide amidase MpaA
MRRVCNATPRHARNCRITRITNATSDGADMEALLIGANANAGGVEAVGGSTVVGPWVFVMAGQHAREWLPIMAAVFLAERLLEGMATARAVPELASPDVRQLAELLTRITVVIIPITNIDGFKYTYSRQGTAGGLSCSVRDTVKRKCLRLWRKSRSAMPVHTRIGLGGDCSGVDLNRNWPVDWGHLRGGKRASPDPCNDEYAGTAPFSAPETRAIRDFILAVSQPPMAALDIHAFAQAVLGPWSHSNGDPIGAGRIDRIGEAVAAAMSGVHGAQHVYGRGTADDLIYLASGTFVDWMFVMHRIPAYTVELRPRAGRFSGFDLGTANIILAGDEITVGVLALMYTALQELEMSSASTVRGFEPFHTENHKYYNITNIIISQIS